MLRDGRTAIRKTLRELHKVDEIINHANFETMTKDDVDDFLFEVGCRYPAKKKDCSYHNTVQDF